MRIASQKLLRDAVEILHRSGDRYELACALADLAQAHRALRDENRAKLFGRRAWRMAVECGAQVLAAQLASDALVRTAAPEERPTRDAPASGRTAPAHGAVANLTYAEHRVGALAAYGMTNREIARKLFITASTVEQHLTHIYRKLNVNHRSKLPTYGWDWDLVDTA